jgi:hypothetical protein
MMLLLRLRRYHLVGWLVTKIAKRIARRRASKHRSKLGAAATVFGLLLAALVAAWFNGDS